MGWRWPYALSLVVLTEIATNSFNYRWELALVITTFRHKIGHHARRFLPTVVRILQFRAAGVCAKEGENNGEMGFSMYFEALESWILVHFLY